MVVPWSPKRTTATPPRCASTSAAAPLSAGLLRVTRVRLRVVRVGHEKGRICSASNGLHARRTRTRSSRRRPGTHARAVGGRAKRVPLRRGRGARRGIKRHGARSGVGLDDGDGNTRPPGGDSGCWPAGPRRRRPSSRRSCLGLRLRPHDGVLARPDAARDDAALAASRYQHLVTPAGTFARTLEQLRVAADPEPASARRFHRVRRVVPAARRAGP